MFDGMVGRQPIFTRSLDLFGYELCFRSAETLRYGGDDEYRWPDTAQSANAAYSLHELVGDSRALIRVPPSALATCGEWTWPKSQVVLALPMDALRDRAVDSTAERLASEGFVIALRHSSCDSASLRSFADYVSICSLDAARMMALQPDWRRRHDQGVHLMIRDLETPDQYERFMRLGFDYYQGRFFERPRRSVSGDIPASRVAVLQLLAKLQNPRIDIAEVEAIIRRDMILSYKLLRLINSAFYRSGKPVESISRAVLFFGLERIKHWAAVLLINSVDYRPRELLTMATVRARTCELLAQHLGRPNPEHYYLAGLFSLLDAILDMPKARMLACLNLAPPIQDALLHGCGPVGEVLHTVLAFERAEVPVMGCRDLAEGVPASLCLEAIRWADELRQALSSSASAPACRSGRR